MTLRRKAGWPIQALEGWPAFSKIQIEVAPTLSPDFGERWDSASPGSSFMSYPVLYPSLSRTERETRMG